MSESAATKDTFFASETPETGRIYDFIRAHRQKTGQERLPQFFLSGPEAGDQVEIPPEIYEVLAKAVEAMQRGMAVTITPASMTLTTQQAAEILGVTRPTVVRFLDAGKIPFEKPGSHRRVMLEDVLAFKAARRAVQYGALDLIGFAADEDAEVVLDRLKKAKVLAGNRRRKQEH